MFEKSVFAIKIVLWESPQVFFSSMITQTILVLQLLLYKKINWINQSKVELQNCFYSQIIGYLRLKAKQQ